MKAKLSTFISWLLCIAVFVAGGFGLFYAMRSPLFLVQVVEVSELPERAPVTAEEITRIADIPVGEINLFELRLDDVKLRVEAHPWVREARIYKRFPQTVAIEIDFREPEALLQTPDGALSYVDDQGQAFAKLDLKFRGDLPVMNGFESKDHKRIREALKLVHLWESSSLDRVADLSSIRFNSPRGYEGWITYGNGSDGGRSRLFFGAEVGETLKSRLGQVEDVLLYLKSKGIAARQISADLGKKIVVKIAHGS